MTKTIILGGGISGLSAGWFLKQRYGDDLALTIVEKDQAPGGWVKTTKKDGFLFEEGPRSCRSKGSGVETLRLIEALGLQDEVIVADKAAQYRYLWLRKRLRALPTGPLSLLTSPFLKDMAVAVVRDLITSPSQQDDESIYDFAARRFGTGVANRFFDPLTKGIYAGDIHELSMKSCFSPLYEWEQARGSVIKGAFCNKKKDLGPVSPFIEKYQKTSLFALKNGLGTLVQALASRLERHLHLSTAVTGLRFHPEGVEVDLSDGTTLEADRLISTIPASQLSSLFVPLHQDFANLLAAIPSVSTTVVNVGYRKNVLQKQGFGYLVPTSEKEDILGVVWNSSAFPQQNQHPDETRLTVMLGSAHMDNFHALSEEEFTKISLEALSRHLGIDTQPDTIAVQIAKFAIPQYVVGHSKKVALAEDLVSSNFPTLTLAGNSFYGVSVNDCIAHSKQIAGR